MASQHAKETTTLRNEFRTNWDGVTYPVAWPNAPFTIPDPESTTGWVRWQIIPGTGQRQDLGGTHGVEHVGLVIVQVFTKAHAGKKANDDLLDDADEIYFNFRSTDGGFHIRTLDSYVNTIGVDGAWYQQNLVVPYVRESIRSA